MASEKKTVWKTLSRRKVIYGAEVLKQDQNGMWAYTNFFKLTEKDEGEWAGVWILDDFIRPKWGNTLPYFEPNCTYSVVLEEKRLINTDNDSAKIVYTLIGEPEPFKMSKDSDEPIENKDKE